MDKINQHPILMLLSDQYRYEVLNRPRYQEKKRLLTHGYRIYSQSDEDGIIYEIFNRVGTDTMRFVEFGAQNGIECNAHALLRLHDWSGTWLEANGEHYDSIIKNFHAEVKSGSLQAVKAFITAENINDLLANCGEIDLLSIDIDMNDIWVWQAITVVKPRVVVIEYNGSFPPPISIAVVYNANRSWHRTNYAGASLEAIVNVGRKKGYSLVGCGFSGVNAFFVRDDLLGDHFQEPFTAANHYEPGRFFMMARPIFPTEIGPLVKVP